MTRPRHVWYEKEPRNELLQFRISTALKEELLALATHYETTSSEIVRFLISEASQTLRDGYQPPRREEAEMMAKSIKARLDEIHQASAITISQIELYEALTI
jgi:hypothetical protein